MYTFAKTAVLLGLCLSLGTASAQVIKPARDITKIKTDGVELNLLYTMIETNNAHPIDSISFFIGSGKGPAAQVPFEVENNYLTGLTMRRGADCAVSAARVLRQDGKLRVVYAERKGEWLDKKSARLTVYQLEKNEGLHGTPDLYFKKFKSVDTLRLYCDMSEALDQETSLYK